MKNNTHQLPLKKSLRLHKLFSFILFLIFVGTVESNAQSKIMDAAVTFSLLLVFNIFNF